MAFDFPASPSTGTLYQPSGGPTYRYDGTVWSVIGAQFQGAMPSDAPPSNPVPGQLWWESDTGALFIYYDDGNSRQWVQISGSQLVDLIYSAAADLQYSLKTGPNRFVWNDKADGTGTEVASMSETGALTTASLAATTVTSGGSPVLTAGNYPATTVYTGTNAAETVFPVGHIIYVYHSALVARNTAGTPRIDSATSIAYQYGGTGAFLAGGWVAHGGVSITSPTTNLYLVQRVG
jgi:hypothetical protein